MNAAQSLNALGVREGTDKSRVWHDYLRHYADRFEPLRDQEFNLIEIGAANGASLHMWEKFLPLAHIIGVDILEVCRRHAGGRISIEIGSQDDPEFLARLCKVYPPLVVIDDGSHLARHILCTFEQVFPKLLSGGWYVIEDLDICGGRTEVPVTPHDYFGEIAKALIYGAGALDPNAASGKVVTLVDRVEFVRGAVFIRKRDPEAVKQDLSATEKVADQAGHRQNWYFLARTLIELGEPLERAEAAIRKALAADADDFRYQSTLAVVLARKGDFKAAVDAAEHAVRCGPRQGDEASRLQKHLDGLRRLHHQREQAKTL